MRLSPKKLLILSLLGIIVVSGQAGVIDEGSGAGGSAGSDSGSGDGSAAGGNDAGGGDAGANSGADAGGGAADSGQDANAADNGGNASNDAAGGNAGAADAGGDAGGADAGGDAGGADNMPIIPDNNGSGGQVANITLPGENLLKSMSNLVNGISGDVYIRGSGNKIRAALEDLQGTEDNLSQLASLLNSDGSAQINDNIKNYFKDLSDADNRAYSEVERTVALLFRGENQDQCYNSWLQSVSAIYIGWTKFADEVQGSSLMSSLEQVQTFEGWCQANQDGFKKQVDDLANIMSGQGECDLMQSLYDGNLDANIWTAWKNNIDEKAGLNLLYLYEGYTIINACNQFNQDNNSSNEDSGASDAAADDNAAANGGAAADDAAADDSGAIDNNDAAAADNSTNNAENDQANEEEQVDNLESDQQLEQFQSIISRILKFDALARLNVQTTISQNLQQYLKSVQGLDLQSVAFNLNSLVQSIYDDYVLQMGVVYSNSSSSDFYTECWNCANIFQGIYRVSVAWLPANSNSSLSQLDLTVLIDNYINSKMNNGSSNADNSSNSDNADNSNADAAADNNNSSEFNDQLNSDFNELFPNIDGIDVSNQTEDNGAAAAEENNNQAQADVVLTNEEIADLIWNGLGNCTSGLWIINSQIPNYVNTQFQDRLVYRLGADQDIYVWGIDEFCYGRPQSI